MSYRDELIQVAAVAVAMIEDYDHGSADFWREHPASGHKITELVLDEVRSERERQDHKWGPQSHHAPTWLTILGEEFGEACEAALSEIFDD